MQYSFMKQNPPATLGAALGLFLPVVGILLVRLVGWLVDPASDPELHSALLVASWGAVAFGAMRLGVKTQNYTYPAEKVEDLYADAEATLADASADPSEVFELAEEEREQYSD